MFSYGIQAETYFANCQAAAKSGEAACGPNDRFEGMDNPEKVRSLLAAIDRYGDFVKKSAACGRIPAHFANQQLMANAMAQLSDAKAAACTKTLTQCRSVCSESAGRFDGVAQVYRILGLSDQALDASNKSLQSQAADGHCASYTKEAAEFQAQAANARRDEEASQIGYQKSLQDNPSDVGNGNAECRSVPIAGGQSQSFSAGPGALMPVSSSGQSRDGLENRIQPSFNLTQRPMGSTDPGSRARSAASPPLPDSKNLTQRPISAEGVGQKIIANGGTSSPLPKPRVDSEAIKHFRSLASVRGEIVASNALKNSASIGNSVIGMKLRTIQTVSIEKAQVSGRFISLPDGITPALGPDIFEKVSSQYRKQAYKLTLD